MSNQLERARENIDEINHEIVDLVDQRMEEVEKIVNYKERNNMDVKDEDREEKVVEQFADNFEEKDLPRERGRQLGRLLIDTAVDMERDKISNN